MKIIPLTQGWLAIVDDEDYERLSQHKWQASKSRRQWTAASCRWVPEIKTPRNFIMSREVLHAPKDVQVDHIHKDDGVIDNRKENLRFATNQQNTQNMRPRLTSKRNFKGVFRPGRNKQWQASIRVGKKNVYLGLFKDEIDAACAYDAAARIAHGEFAHTNFPYVFVV